MLPLPRTAADVAVLGNTSAPLIPYAKAFWGLPRAVDTLTLISGRAKSTRYFHAGQKVHLHYPPPSHSELKQKPIGSSKRSQVIKYPELFLQTLEARKHSQMAVPWCSLAGLLEELLQIPKYAFCFGPSTSSASLALCMSLFLFSFLF